MQTFILFKIACDQIEPNDLLVYITHEVWLLRVRRAAVMLVNMLKNDGIPSGRQLHVLHQVSLTAFVL